MPAPTDPSDPDDLFAAPAPAAPAADAAPPALPAPAASEAPAAPEVPAAPEPPAAPAGFREGLGQLEARVHDAAVRLLELRRLNQALGQRVRELEQQQLAGRSGGAERAAPERRGAAERAARLAAERAEVSRRVAALAKLLEELAAR